MNDFTRLTPEQGFHVYGWMRTLFDLSGTELLLFAIVYSYGKDTGGIRFFMEWTGAGRNTVIRALDALEEAGLITATDTEQGKLKKYTLSESALSKINQSQNGTSPKMQPVPKQDYPPSQNGTTTSPKMGLPPSQNGTSNQTKKKIESKLERKIKKNTTVDINSTPREEEQPLVKAAMKQTEPPAFHEVYHAMRHLLVRPMGTELEKCAHAFYDLRELQGWSNDWKSHLSRYAASWAAKVRNAPPQREKARPCQPDDPAEDFGEIPW